MGALISVHAQYTDGGGFSESETSAAVGAIVGVNDGHSGTVSISGTPTEDQVLTASHTLTDVDGLGTVGYQWQRNGVDISGETGSTYTLTDVDVGEMIRVVASYIDGQGFSESETSAAVGAIAAVNDSPVGSVTISGSLSQGSLLTASHTLSDADGLGTISYQWQRGGVDIGGATGATYTLVAGDVGAMIRVVAEYTDGQGFDESVAAAAVGPIGNVNDPPAGSVSISGTPTEDQVLTASHTLTDADGLGTISYQWQRDGVDISGGTGTTYTLDDADVGRLIRVVARYTDGGGTLESVNSSAVGPINNVNDLPAGTVMINGITAEDQVLTTSHSLSDADGLGVLSYQWKRGGADISGAVASSYTLTEDDVNSTIHVTVSYTDGHGTVESVDSATAGPIANVNDLPTGSVTITGTATEGSLLTAGNTLADGDGLGTISYQWKRNGTDISGATSSTYTLVAGDVGTLISVQAAYTDGHGTAEQVVSGTLGPITNTNNAPTGAVLISGTPTEDQVLAASNTLADVDGLGPITYQWQRNGVDIIGGTGATYTLTDSDVGQLITAVANYTDGMGTAEIVSSAAVGPVANVNDNPTGTVSISGTPAEDQLLTASHTLSDNDGMGTVTWQWQRNGVNIVGAGSSTYLLGDDDVAATIRVVASYTDLHGTSESVTSSPVGPVSNTNDAPAGTVTISGTPTEDQILTAAHTLADADGLGVINWQWQRNGVDIAGATTATYTLADDDVGAAIRVVASYTDGGGTSETVSSAAVGPVANVNDAPSGLVTIAGVAAEDQTLMATSTLTDADGLGIISYQWQRNGVNISGATGSTYTTDDADVNATLSVVATYTDGHGTAESVSSAGFGPIANVNDAPQFGSVGRQTVSEDAAVGTSVVTVAATDVDPSDTLSYALVAGNTDGAFGIRADGTILVVGALDHEVTPAYSLTVQVTDNGTPTAFDTIVVTIDVSALTVVPTTRPAEAPEPPAEEKASSEESKEETTSEDDAGSGETIVTPVSAAPQAGAAASAAAANGGQNAAGDEAQGVVVAVVVTASEDDVSVQSESIIETNLDRNVETSVRLSSSARTARDYADESSDASSRLAAVAYQRVELNRDLQQMREQIESPTQIQFYTAASAVTATSSLSVGYVVWAIRGGWLASSLLAQMPAWQLVDPLVVLSSLDETAGGGDDESLQDMLDKSGADAKSTSSKPSA